MYIQHTVKKGEDFIKICRKYKARKPYLVWNMPQNRKLKVDRNNMMSQIQPGDVITLLDPKAKIFIFTYQGRTSVYEYKEWRKVKRILAAKIKKSIYGSARKEFFDLGERHREVAMLGADYPLASLLTNWFGGVKDDKVVKTMRKANDAQAKLGAALDKGDFDKITPLIGDVEKTLAAYGTAVAEYRNKVISGSKSAYAYVQFTRDSACVIATATAMTVAAPAAASYATMARLGFCIGASAGAIKSVATEIGEYAAGNMRSWDKITWSIIKNTATAGFVGFFGGAAGKFVCKHVAGTLANKLMQYGPIRKAITKHGCQRFFYQFRCVKKFVESRVCKTQYGSAHVMEYLEDSIAKWMCRLPVGAAATFLNKRLMADHKRMEQALARATKKANGKEKLPQLATMVAMEMEPDIYYGDTIVYLAKGAKKIVEDLIETLKEQADGLAYTPG